MQMIASGLKQQSNMENPESVARMIDMVKVLYDGEVLDLHFIICVDWVHRFIYLYHTADRNE